MNKLFVSALLAAGIMVGGGSAFATDSGEEASSEAMEGTSTEMTGESSEQMKMDDEMMMRMGGVTGEVTGIEGDTIRIKDKQGITRSFEITGDQNLEELSVETIQIGDKVYVQFQEQGREVEIHKISESGKGTMMEESESGAMMEESGSGAMESGESSETSSTTEGKGDFDKESRTPAEGSKKDPTQ